MGWQIYVSDGVEVVVTFKATNILLYIVDIAACYSKSNDIIARMPPMKKRVFLMCILFTVNSTKVL